MLLVTCAKYWERKFLPFVFLWLNTRDKSPLGKSSSNMETYLLSAEQTIQGSKMLMHISSINKWLLLRSYVYVLWVSQTIITTGVWSNSYSCKNVGLGLPFLIFSCEPETENLEIECFKQIFQLLMKILKKVAQGPHSSMNTNCSIPQL